MRRPRWPLSFLVVAACSSPPPEAAPPARPAVAAKAPIKPGAATDPNVVPLFTYSAVGKRDPFRSYLQEVADAAVDHSTRKKEETEKYEIDQYRLTGLITGTSQPKAMVEDPDGHGHVLHIGSRLGKNGGRVTHVAPNSIVVLEETRDPTGKKLRLPISIRLPKSEFEDVVQR